jgi:DNA-binding winged helix-turn-helix (wHTH) protein
MTADPRVVYEFGPFRMDPDAQVLLRGNDLIPVAPKAFETLLVLVRRSRDVVTKEELLKEVWPNSFVEESNLSQNIFLLRKALGDTAENRQYIVTLPGRGYRFAAPVRTVTERGETLVAHARTRTQIVIEENEAGTDEAMKMLPIPQMPKTSRKLLLSAAVVAVLLALGAFLFMRDRRPDLGEKDTILVADFVNTTGDPVFDETLRQGLSVELEQSPFLALLPDQLIQQTLRLMGQPPDARVTPQIARDLCQRTESTAYLTGSIASLGTQYVLGLKAVSCATGDVLAQEQETASGKEKVLGALDAAAARLRRKLGESLKTVEKFSTPLEQATTPSLEALQAYSFGRRAMSGRGDWSAAVPFFLRAISLDPNFAIAYARLGMCDRNLGEATLGAQYVEKAFQLRERASESERFYIDSHYYLIGVADLEKSRQVLELWAQTYPRDFTPHVDLTDIYSQLGQYDQGLAAVRGAAGLDANGVNYAQIAASDICLNHLEEAESTIQEAQEKKLDSPSFHLLLYRIAFLQNDSSGMAQQEAWASGRPGAEDALLGLEADTESYFGRLEKARDLSDRAVESAEQAENTEVAAGYQAEAAFREAVFGNFVEARARAAKALALSNGRAIEYEAALTLAMTGDAPRARALADDLVRRFPEDTIVRFTFLPAIRAELALSANNSSEALDAIQTATPYELGTPRGPAPALYPAYLRGKAYLAAHRGSEAAAEFQRILDQPGIVVNEPVGALAHLGLARAYALSGDSAKARAQYEEFFGLWKSADPDIPVLKQAKLEFGNLR